MQAIFQSILTLNITFTSFIVCLITSLIIGFAVAFTYMKTGKRYTNSFVVTLALLPAVVQIVIMMVNGELGTSVAIVGAFSLVRFRSIPGTARESSFIFFAMGIGLATGMGFLLFAAIMTVIISLAYLLLDKLNFGVSKKVRKQLRITIAEDLNYTEVFDDIFEKYTSYNELEKIKTTNMGSMFDLYYIVELKDASKEKEMIDEIRCRNGNLTIICGKVEKTPDLYL